MRGLVPQMAAMTNPSFNSLGGTSGATESSNLILRFDRVERIAHWTNAVLFLILMATALPLYYVQVESIIGRRALIAEIHTWVGLALPVPLLISLCGSWGSTFRRDVRRFNLWTKDEIRWLKSFGREHLPELDKFNPGQKLNAVFTSGSILVMVVTGLIMKWFSPFPLSWRTGATFVHDVLATVIFLVVAGHITFALANKDALRSIFKGTISESWAARHAVGWLREQRPSSRYLR